MGKIKLHNQFKYKFCPYIPYAIMRNIYFIILSGFLLYSCSDNRKQNWQCDFTADDFERVNLTLNEGSEVNIGDAILGRPVLIQLLDKGILAVSDSKSDNMAWLIDMENNKSKGILNRGEGPEELTELTTMSSHGNRLSVASMNDGKLLCFNVNADSLSLELSTGIRLPYQPLRSIFVNDSVTFSIAPTFTGHRYNIYHTNDSSVEYYDIFPLDSAFIEMRPDNTVFQSNITLSPDGKLIAIACMQWNTIELIDIDKNEIKVIYGPEPTYASIAKKDRGMAYSYVQNPRWYTWHCQPVLSNDRMYFGYDGYCRKENDQQEHGNKFIYSFSREGKPLKIYNFDTVFTSFTVDEENNCFYVVHNEPEPTIIKYPLK